MSPESKWWRSTKWWRSSTLFLELRDFINIESLRLSPRRQEKIRKLESEKESAQDQCHALEATLRTEQVSMTKATKELAASTESKVREARLQLERRGGEVLEMSTRAVKAEEQASPGLASQAARLHNQSPRFPPKELLRFPPGLLRFRAQGGAPALARNSGGATVPIVA